MKRQESLWVHITLLTLTLYTYKTDDDVQVIFPVEKQLFITSSDDDGGDDKKNPKQRERES